MKQTSFKQYCYYCDKILSLYNSKNNIASISFLHAIKNHHEYLKKLHITPINLILLNIFVLLKSIILFFKNYLSKIFYKGNKIQINPSTILLVSNLIRTIDLKNKDDFYFANFQKICNKNEKNICYRLLINHTKESSERLNYILSKNKISNTYVLPKYLNIYNELSLFINLIPSYFHINKIKKKTSNKIFKHIITRTNISLFDKQTRFNLRISKQLIKLLEIIKPQKIICAFEGFGHERLIFFEARKFNKNISCFAYQHAPVTKINHAIKRSFSKLYDPDQIFLTNKVFMNEFSNSKKKLNIKKTVIGNLKYSKIILNKKKSLKPRCLILPEGFSSETNILFNLGIDSARYANNIEFIFRSNPYLRLKTKKNVPKNFHFSNSDKLASDLKYADFILYRGTGAIIEGLIKGNIPLYYQIKNETSIDPLLKYNPKINIIRDHISLVKIINSYCKKKKIHQKFEKSKIREKYYFRFNEKNILKYFIN